jgi:hypothetical protein
VTLPGAVARGVGAAAGVVVGEASGDIGREADVEVAFTSGTLENVHDPLVFGHPSREATRMPETLRPEEAVRYAMSAVTAAVSAMSGRRDVVWICGPCRLTSPSGTSLGLPSRSSFRGQGQAHVRGFAATVVLLRLDATGLAEP